MLILLVITKTFFILASSFGIESLYLTENAASNLFQCTGCASDNKFHQYSPVALFPHQANHQV